MARAHYGVETGADRRKTEWNISRNVNRTPLRGLNRPPPKNKSQPPSSFFPDLPFLGRTTLSV